MRYAAVLMYADESCPSYSSFRPPVQFVPKPVNEIAIPSSEIENCKEYVNIEPVDWTILKDGEDGRTIEPIPFSGESEQFSVKITRMTMMTFSSRK